MKIRIQIGDQSFDHDIDDTTATETCTEAPEVEETPDDSTSLLEQGAERLSLLKAVLEVALVAHENGIVLPANLADVETTSIPVSAIRDLVRLVEAMQAIAEIAEDRVNSEDTENLD